MRQQSLLEHSVCCWQIEVQIINGVELNLFKWHTDSSVTSGSLQTEILTDAFVYLGTRSWQHC